MKKVKLKECIQLIKKLLTIAEKELENGKVPSREVLDTITTALTITAALPWSKYDIKD